MPSETDIEIARIKHSKITSSLIHSRAFNSLVDSLLKNTTHSHTRMFSRGINGTWKLITRKLLNNLFIYFLLNDRPYLLEATVLLRLLEQAVVLHVAIFTRLIFSIGSPVTDISVQQLGCRAFCHLVVDLVIDFFSWPYPGSFTNCTGSASVTVQREVGIEVRRREDDAFLRPLTDMGCQKNYNEIS